MSYDLIVFGASSFVGKLVCRYLLTQYRPGGRSANLKWAIAGRSKAKLSELMSAFQSEGLIVKGLGLIVADASDEPSLRSMCGQTRVVISTVGPMPCLGSP
jgi:short subunit dehydrogenase-like uncharacterized protein